MEQLKEAIVAYAKKEEVEAEVLFVEEQAVCAVSLEVIPYLLDWV